MAFDTSRLYSTLLTSRLQQDNPALYQVIYQLIGAIFSAQQSITALGGVVNNNSSTTNIQQIVQILGGGDGGDAGESLVVPGPQGIQGNTGATGATGPSGLIGGIIAEDGIDGIDALPIIGPQGNPGTTGAQGPLGVSLFPLDGEDGETGYIQLQPTGGGSSTSSGLVYLGTQTASASTSLAFTSLISSSYDVYIFEFENILPATDNVDFLMRTSTDNGSTYDSGGSDYDYADYLNNTGAFSTNTVSSAAASAVKIMPTMDNGSTGGLNGFLKLYNPLETSRYKSVIYHAAAYLNDNQLYNGTGAGRRLATADVDAVQFLFSSGNIASGIIRMYGVKNS